MHIVRHFRANDRIYCEGYESFTIGKGFYLFRLEVNESFSRVIDVPVLQSGIQNDFVKATINELDEKVRSRRLQAAINYISFDKNKHSEETFIRFLGLNFHPIVALAYELQGDLRIDIITNMAINLLEKEINNDRNLITSICEYLWELVNSNLDFEYKEYYRANIIQEYVQAQTLDTVIALDEYNLEIYKEYPQEVRYPNKKVDDTLWTLSYIKVNKDDGLKRETHNGSNDYHIHYLTLVKGKPERTNKLLTFDSRKDSDELFWENHGKKYIETGLPTQEKKKKQIYDKCYKCLLKIGKQHFRKPSNDAQVYYPE
ncbi:hypothetical protein [Bacillus sp. TD11]|uniref:hypothetical protein n=1 Tax=Bacillus sp. TD11 TaxID=3242875 RepID=UPI00391AADD5